MKDASKTKEGGKEGKEGEEINKNKGQKKPTTCYSSQSYKVTSTKKKKNTYSTGAKEKSVSFYISFSIASQT